MLLEIAEAHLAVKQEVFQENINSSKISAMLHVDSLQAVIEICKQNDYDIAKPMREFPWNTKELVIKDPDGFVLVFIEKLN